MSNMSNNSGLVSNADVAHLMAVNDRKDELIVAMSVEMNTKPSKDNWSIPLNHFVDTSSIEHEAALSVSKAFNDTPDYILQKFAKVAIVSFTLLYEKERLNRDIC